MANAIATYTQTRFMGASVRGFSSTVGWNDQSSTVTIDLAEDVLGGDRFQVPTVGTPARFAVGSFAFEGLVQRWSRSQDFSQNPGYTVTLTDPRELLEGLQCILSGYKDPVAGIPNLINVFGYWENELGYGGSMTNDSGTLWQGPFSSLQLNAGQVRYVPDNPVGIRPAVEILTRNGGPYGGPIEFRGYTYSVDFSGLPSAPVYYRVGGTTSNVLALVTELCSNAGSDFLVYLDGSTIKFKTVSFAKQPDPGAVAAFIASHPEAVSRSYGMELRNEYTNAVLMGGKVRELVQVRANGPTDPAIQPYWGLDPDGNPIAGAGDPTGDDHSFTLNGTEIVDLLGSVEYPCTTGELRYALADFESWAAYVLRNDPDKGKAIGLVNSVDSTSDLAEAFPDVLFRRDLIAQDDEALQRFGEMNESDYWSKRANRAYTFVSRYAQEHYGRKFLVSVPFEILWSFVPDTTQIIRSETPCDAAYFAEGAFPLGMSAGDVDKFATDEGLVECFMAFGQADDIDLTTPSPADCVVGGNGLVYMRASIDQQVGIVYPGGVFPAVVVTLADGLYHRPPDALGGVSDIADMMGIDPAAIAYAVGVRHGSFPVRVGARPLLPVAAAVPLQHERQSYGPWGTFAPWGTPGVPGKVYVDTDEYLTPWSAGDYQTMNAVASAKLAGMATQQQQAETGSLEVPGTPSVQLGDELVAGGPNVTSIDCQVGTQGVTTRYSLMTFTPMLGSFRRTNAERIARLGVLAQQQRRAIRALLARQNQAADVYRRGYLGQLANAAHAVQQATPLDTIMSTMSYAETLEQYRTQASFMTVDELMANCRGDRKDIYKATGGVGLEFLYRPFSSAWSADDAGDMPHFEKAADGVDDGAFSTESIDPVRGGDVDIILTGKDEYGGHLHRLKGDLDFDNARAVGHRTPMVLVGYGLELTGKPIPNAGDETLPVDQWDDDSLKDAKLHPEKWRAGSLLVHWDNFRKGWAFPYPIKGRLDQALGGGGPTDGTMSIYVNGQPLPDKVHVYHDMGGQVIPANTVCWATYWALENRWYLTSAACS